MLLMAFVAGIAGTLETMAQATEKKANQVLVADTFVVSDRPIRTELAGTVGVQAVSEEAPVRVEVAPSEEDDSAETFDAMAVDPRAYLRTHRITPAEGDLRDLSGAAVAVSPMERTWHVGDTLTARVGEGPPVGLRVVAVLPATLIGPTILLPPDFLPEGGPRVYSLLTDGSAKLGMGKKAWIDRLQREQE